MNRLERLEREASTRMMRRPVRAGAQSRRAARFVAAFDAGEPVAVVVTGGPAATAPAGPPPTAPKPPECECPPTPGAPPPAPVARPSAGPPPAAPPAGLQPAAPAASPFAPSEQQALEDLAWVSQATPPEEKPAARPAAVPKDHAAFDRPPGAAPVAPPAHAVFDRMGRDLSRATTYDAGTFSLDALFDDFDRRLAVAPAPPRPAADTLSAAAARADVVDILRRGRPAARSFSAEDEFLDFYRRHLDAQYPNNQPDDSYSRNRDYYTLRALEKAGVKRDEWDPTAGFRANRDRIVRVYDYYRDTYLARPDQFLWAGLGRMAGGAVVGGLDQLPGDPSATSMMMVLIGKDIFLDLAWLHEAFLDDPAKAVTLAREHDTRYPAKASYAEAFIKVAGGSPAEVGAGNLLLLTNEQFTIIQPLYDRLLAAGGVTGLNGFTGRIHPYHRDFVEVVPGGQVLNAADRWKWITEQDGMWDRWVALPAAERKRLVGLPLSDLTAGRFGSPLPEFERPGAP